MYSTPAGVQNFKNLIQGGGYYVDKTDFLKTVFDEASTEEKLRSICKVRLITRPRRFGKTLTMSMFEHFLKLDPEHPGDVSSQQKLFKGTRILEDHDFCNRYMGRFPVISMTFMDFDYAEFDAAYNALAKIVVTLADSFKYLEHSSRLSEVQHRRFANLLDESYLRDQRNIVDLTDSLKTLIELLYIHHGVGSVILIDEYDVPLAKARVNGYYDKMVKVIRAFLSNALKAKDELLQKAVLTGCLRVSKESFFTGLNNLVENTVFNHSDEFSRALGFTKDETRQILEYYGLSEYGKLVEDHYDGYRFGGLQMFCPWDVTRFCFDARTALDERRTVTAGNYWTSTSGNDVINEFMGFFSKADSDVMQALCDGQTQKVRLNPSINYGELSKHRAGDFWTMLVYTGYLTVISGPENGEEGEYEIRIPNREIHQCFSSHIEDFNKSAVAVNSAEEMLDAIVNGDAQIFQSLLFRKLRTYVSLRDFAVKSFPENYYHGMMNGIFSCCGDKISDYCSNQEAGDGYVDIAFCAEDGTLGVVIELKHTRDKLTMKAMAQGALSQIEARKYAEIFVNCTRIFAYGICFSGKNCSVICKEVQLPG